MARCNTCGANSPTQRRGQIDVPCKCGANVKVSISSIDAQGGAMVVHDTLDPNQNWDKVDTLNANTIKRVRCPYTTYVPPAVWCPACQANLVPHWRELCVSGTSAEVEAAQWNYHPTVIHYRQMARDLIKQYGLLKRVEYLSHFPKFEINFVFEKRTVYSGQRRGKYDIHFLSLGYVGEGPRYARFFLEEAGFTMSSDEINAIRPGAIIELHNGEVITSYPEKGPAHGPKEPSRGAVCTAPSQASGASDSVKKRWWQFWNRTPRLGSKDDREHEPASPDEGVASEPKPASRRSAPDQSFFENIALNDPDSEVRRSAVEQLTSIDIVRKIWTNDADKKVRETAKDILLSLIVEVDERDVLLELEKTPDKSVKKAAAERLCELVEELDDQDELQNLATSSMVPEVRTTAIEKLEDMEMLSEIAGNENKRPVRKAAVDRLCELVDALDDQDELQNLAASSPILEVRTTAIEKLEDMEALLEIAGKESEGAVRKAAVERLCELVEESGDQDELQDLATSSTVPEVRTTAIEKLEGMETLSEIAGNETEGPVRKAAVARLCELVEALDDQDELQDLATSSTIPELRTTAIERLGDVETLLEITGKESEGPVREAAVERLCELVQESDDQDELQDFAASSPILEVRTIAIEKLEDLETLSEIAGKESEGPVRKAAMDRLSDIVEETEDQQALEDMAFTLAISEIRRMAVEKLDDPDVLVQVTESEKDPSIRKAALDRLRELKEQDD